MNERAHLYVSGIVQGVFYRAFTREVANSLGLKGWVRNLPDGRVEIIFEGERSLIEIAINKCRKGPPGAQVKDIEIKWESDLEGFQDFRIRY